MNTDPLSDEACIQWMREQNMPPFTMNALFTWQECARRAEGLMDGLSRRIDTVQTENKLLRDLLIECAEYLERDKHVGMPRKIRAALEGK